MDPQTAQVLTGVVTATATLTAGFGVAVFTQRSQARQRDRERAAESAAKVSKVVRDQLDAATALQQVVHQIAPRWNSWQPKLMMLGSAVLEGLAVRKAGAEVVWAQVGRIAVDHGEKELSLVPPIASAADRVRLAAIDAALLPRSEVRDAVLNLAEAAAQVNEAYGVDMLWSPRKARAAREKADIKLGDAIADWSLRLFQLRSPRRRVTVARGCCGAALRFHSHQGRRRSSRASRTIHPLFAAGSWQR
jgi:hypothetical protein